MKRIGKIFLGVLCAAALAAGGFWINDRLSYPIDPGMDGLEGSLKNWLNRGIDAVHGYQPRLYEPVTLGERTYVPMEVGEKLGYALLERSITGRYRIAHTSSGNAPFRCGVIEENGGKQLLFQGRNTFGEIDRVQITLDRGYEYELKLPPERGLFHPHRGGQPYPHRTCLRGADHPVRRRGAGHHRIIFHEHGRHSVKTA